MPLDKAYQNGYYLEMVDLIRSLFGQALKTNENLYFAVITGCLRIARESIFTGLNNFKVRTISDLDFAKYFSFRAVAGGGELGREVECGIGSWICRSAETRRDGDNP